MIPDSSGFDKTVVCTTSTFQKSVTPGKKFKHEKGEKQRPEPYNCGRWARERKQKQRETAIENMLHLHGGVLNRQSASSCRFHCRI